MKSNKTRLTYPIFITLALAAACTEDTGTSDDDSKGDGDSTGDGDSSGSGTGGLGQDSGTGGGSTQGQIGSSCTDVSDCLTGLVCSSEKCQDPQEAVLACIQQCGPAKCVAESLACDAQTGCMDILDCQFSCDADDTACKETCVPDTISTSALDALESYSSCVTDECEACVTIGGTPQGSGGAGGAMSTGGESSGGAGTGGDTSSGGTSSGGTNSGGTGAGGDASSGGASSGGASSGGAGTGGEASTGGSGSGGDSSSGGGPSGVGGGGSIPTGCGSITLATGTPKIIDNFDHAEFPNLPDDGDGRVGTWEHQYWNHDGPANSAPALWVDDGDGDGHVNFSCIEEDWCNTLWDEEYPWEQWAAFSTLFGEYSEEEPNCYDASIYTGIRFDARSLFGDDVILVQMRTPDSDPELGWVYKSYEYALGTEWDGIEIPFSTVVMPDWVAGHGGPSGAVDPEALISMSFVVRTVYQETDGLTVIGESLLPYDIEIDNLRFY